MSEYYEIVKEQIVDSDQFMKLAYNKKGDLIGNVEDAKYLCDELGICPELRLPQNHTCSIGFSKENQKWYGWSHRAIHGFGIGSTVKVGDCAYVAGTPEELIEDYVEFFADDILYPDEDKRKAEAIKLRAHCTILPSRKGILIEKPGLSFDATSISVDERGVVVGGPQEEKVVLQPSQRIVMCGRGEWIAETLEDARQMACDFAESVS